MISGKSDRCRYLEQQM